MKKLSEQTIKELEEWSQEIVDHLAKERKYSAYQVQIKLAPNPLNYDGMDSVEIDLHDSNGRNKSIITGYQFNLPEALKNIEQQITNLPIPESK